MIISTKSKKKNMNSVKSALQISRSTKSDMILFKFDILD